MVKNDLSVCDVDRHDLICLCGQYAFELRDLLPSRGASVTHQLQLSAAEFGPIEAPFKFESAAAPAQVVQIQRLRGLFPLAAVDKFAVSTCIICCQL